MASHKLIWPLLLAIALVAQRVSAQGPAKKSDDAQVAPSPPPPSGDTKGGEPPPQGAPPQPAASPAPAPPAEADPSACNPMAGEICITAAKQENLGDGHHHASGFVDVRFGDARLQADELDFYVTPKPDGTSSRRIVAHGSAVFLRGEERLSGDRLEMDLDSGVGVFDNAMGYAQPGIFIEARKIERVSADTYRIHGGRFSSCSQPNPRWRFGAQSATLKVDDKVKAKHVVFRVLGVPAFYFPYFIYPIQEDQRSSGFLLPHYGSDQVRGRNVGGAFFWAMGRSLDQTFAVDYYSKWGWGFGHDFRYRRKSPSGGDFRSFFNRRESEAGGTVWEHDLNWSANQLLPGKLRATVRVQDTSTQQFQQRFQEDPDAMFRRTRIRSFALQRNFSLGNVRLLADSNETYFYGEQQVLQHLPSLSLNGLPKKERHTGLVFSYSAGAERLARFRAQDPVAGDVASPDETHTAYSRFDLTPRLSRPLSARFLQVTPQLTFRYTRYGVSDLDPDLVDADLTGPPVDRRFLEGRVEVQGPHFSRIFVTPNNFYSERFKHVVGPQLIWTYRSRVENFDLIPFFDGEDRTPGTNQLFYGLVQRFYSKRPGRSGKPETWEFLNWSVGQTYYVDVAASAYDPSYQSATFGPGGDPAHYSPIQTRLRLRPTNRLDANFNLEYDVNFKLVKSLGLSLRADSERAGLTVNWSRFKNPQQNPDQIGPIPPQDTLRGDLRLSLVPKHLTVNGGAYYDFNRKLLASFFARGRYDVQCCGLIVDVSRRDFGGGQFVWTKTFSIELANIGSSGNFLGTQPMPGGAGRGFP